VSRRRRLVSVGVVLATTLLAGCAPLPPQQPVNSLEPLVGRWRGNVQFGGGPYELFYLTVNPDGGIVASWGITTRWGNLSLSGGRARFSLYIWSGNLDYLEGNGQRIIILREDFGMFYAQATPLR